MGKAKIHYLYNSGFIIETESHILIFDYYNDDCHGKSRSLKNGVIPDETLNTGKDIYVFVSHGHYDHFNSLIFNWKNINPKIKFILSSDIEIKDTYPEHVIISSGEIIKIKDVLIEAYGSTDLGVSFLIMTENMRIFHAGDLNWWNWYDESDESNAYMAKAFKSEIDKIKDKSIDIALFPVDPRLKECYSLGGEYFIKNLCPKLFIPMHFGDHTEVTEGFAEALKGYNTRIAIINERGQEILF